MPVSVILLNAFFLGSDVLFVRLVAYEEYPPFSNDTGSTGQLRTVYYIVIVLSKVPNRDFTNEQAAFRQMVLNGTLPYVINFDEVYPIPEPDAKNAFLIVEAMDPSTFPGLVSGSEVPDAIIRLYQLAIGNRYSLSAQDGSFLQLLSGKSYESI